MKVTDSKAADGLLVAKAALAATVGRTAVRMLTDARVRHLDDEPLLPVLFRAASTIHGYRSAQL
jgi:hypothetical protein